MKNKNVYDPLGVFNITNNKVGGEIIIILPHNLEDPTKKYNIKTLYQCDVSHGGTNGILVVIKITSGGNEIDDLSEAGNPSDYHKISLKVKIENFNIDDKNARLIIFHSNDFQRESERARILMNCIKEFVSEYRYDPDRKFDFQNCPPIRPEKAGSSILVGV